MSDSAGDWVSGAATAAEIVALMRERISAGEDEMARRHGAPSVEIAREIEAALMAAIETRLSYVVLWEQFLSTPDEVALPVIGVVQALMDADPVLAQWLVEALEQYRQA